MDHQHYAVTIARAEPRALAGVSAIVTPGTVSAVFRRYLDRVYASAKTHAIALDGQNVFVYRRRDDGNLAVEFCVGVVKMFQPVDDIVPCATPGGLVATVTHWGDYGGLGAAHSAVVEWCTTHRREHVGTWWEVYGHWYDDPARVRTDVFYLLREHGVGAASNMA